MHHVANLVSITDANDVAEIVRHDAEMVAMIADICRQEPAITPAQYDLLAAVGGLPIHFHVQLICFDQPWSLRQSFAYLGQEEDESMSLRPITGERRVRLNRQPAIDGAPDQPQRLGCVPGLGADGNGER